MMKQFCDGCGKETIHNMVSPRLYLRRTLNGTKIVVEIVVQVNGTWNRGELCRACLQRVLEEGIECNDNGKLAGEP